MRAPPITYDPDLDLKAVSQLLQRAFPKVGQEDRIDVLHEAGQRLVRVGQWLQTDAAWCPEWPQVQPLEIDDVAKKEKKTKKKPPPRTVRVTLTQVPDEEREGLLCTHCIQNSHKRFHQLGYKSAEVNGELTCREIGAVHGLIEKSDGSKTDAVTCAWHYNAGTEERNQMLRGEMVWPTLGDVRSSKYIIVSRGQVTTVPKEKGASNDGKN